MVRIVEEEYFTFDDVLILPGYSEINSRETINTSTKFLGLIYEVPIISANMDYITGAEMAIAMNRAGGLGILHRFNPENVQDEEMAKLHRAKVPVAFSVGVRDPMETLERVKRLLDIHYSLIVCIDVAHGDHKRVVDLIPKLNKLGALTIAGNVATIDGFNRLAQAGAYAVKVGIGPGSVCTTREVTGVGVPQLSAIYNIARARNEVYPQYKGTAIIADGGIKNSGDMVKALAAGADMVMLGSLLAGASECPVESIETGDGHKVKPYRGQSIFGTNGLKYTPEGIAGYVIEKGPVSGIIKHLRNGLRSGMSYVGATNLRELRENTEFIRVSNHTQLESNTRIKTTF